MAERLILSFRRSRLYPVRVSAIFRADFSGVGGGEFWGGRKLALDP